MYSPTFAFIFLSELLYGVGIPVQIMSKRPMKSHKIETHFALSNHLDFGSLVELA